MSKRDYKELEDHILKICDNQQNINFNGSNYEISQSGRPTVKGSGECKTDVLIRLYKSAVNRHDYIDIKISIKKSNAEFLANKLTPTDAENLLGEDWEKIVIDAISLIQHKFEDTKLYAKTKKNGSRYTLGWRMEVANKPRKLSAKLQLPEDEIINVIYRGKSLSDEKKNAYVLGKEVKNSGIADFLLEGDKEDFKSIDDVLNSIQDLNLLSTDNVYLIFTASNYFPDKVRKIEGNRYLAVYVNWTISNNKLTPKIIFDEPLKKKGVDDILPLLKSSLLKLKNMENDS